MNAYSSCPSTLFSPRSFPHTCHWQQISIFASISRQDFTIQEQQAACYLRPPESGNISGHTDYFGAVSSSCVTLYDDDDDYDYDDDDDELTIINF
jgi:hypothetical protein